MSEKIRAISQPRMNRVTQPTKTSTEDAVDLADILLTFAENLRLLVIGPIALGAMAFGIAHWLPEKFESVAILKAEPSIASYMTSATVLGGALKSLGYLKDLNEDQAEEARLRLAEQVSVVPGRNDQPITLRVTAQSPDAAQRMAKEILRLTMEGSKPRAVELRRLTLEKEALSQQAIELANTSKTAQSILERGNTSDNLGSVAESIASLSNNLITVRENLLKVEQKLDGLSEDDLLQSPTLPRKPYAPNKPLIAVFATLVSGLLLLIFVFVRQSLRASPLAERHAERLKALKQRYRVDR